MIKSLKSSNGSFAQVGNPETQASSSGLDNASSQPSEAIAGSEGYVGTADVELGVQTIAADGSISSATSLNSLVKSMMSDSSVIVPGLQSSTNVIGMSKMESSNAFRQSSSGYAAGSKKFEPYEELTGISQERPEIVMLTNFLPMFDYTLAASSKFSRALDDNGKNVSMTDAGQFIDTQMQLKVLHRINSIKMVSRLSSTFSLLGRKTREKKAGFERNVDVLEDHTNFLLELVRSNETLKAQLDLRNDLHVVDTKEASTYHSSNYGNSNGGESFSRSADDDVRSIGEKYTPCDVLVDIGYAESKVKTVFSSTKIWLALTAELRDVLSTHSLQLIDVEPVMYRRDKSASAIVRPNIDKFGVNMNIPDIPDVERFVATTPDDSPRSVSALSQAWRTLYQSVHFKSDEARIAALVHLASKEYRYSYGLSLEGVRSTLSEKFNYNFNQDIGNVSLFKAVFGSITLNISDFPTANNASMANVAQQQISDDLGVLTFESKYIETDNGTLTPGGVYYVENTLKTDGKNFVTKPLESIAKKLSDASRRLNLLTHGMNLMAVRTQDQHDRSSTQFSSVMASPYSFVERLLDGLVNMQNGNSLNDVKNDVLSSVYAFATKNEKVKSALFLFTMARVSAGMNSWANYSSSSAPENTPLAQELVNVIAQALRDATTQAPPGNSGAAQANVDTRGTSSSSAVTYSTVDAGTYMFALLAGTAITKHVESVMKQVFFNFRKNNTAISGSKTRYSGMTDTVIMMIVFDALVHTIAKFTDSMIVSSDLGATDNNPSGVRYTVVRTHASHSNSMIILRNRVAKEISLTRKLLFAAMNTLRKLSGAMQNQVNYLNGPPATRKLNNIADVLKSPSMLRMLMSEQQIVMLASFVHDLKSRVGKKSSGGSIPNDGDVDRDDDFDGDDELKMLDDSVISPKLKEALYGALGTSDFASKKGYNKKVMSIGLPMGFAQKLTQRIELENLKRSSFANKQSDIIRIVIHKVDMQNPDVVYKPQRYLFELSRFVVRSDNHYMNIPDDPTIDDVVAAIPTRDFGQSQEKNSEISYWSSSSGRTSYLPAGTGRAFADESYDFLTDSQKEEIATNHVMSFLLEAYVRLLTGISVAEYNFEMEPVFMKADSEFNSMLIQHHLTDVVDSSTSRNSRGNDDNDGVLFGSTSGGSSQWGSSGKSSNNRSDDSGGSSWGSKSKKKKTSTGRENSDSYDSSPRKVIVKKDGARVRGDADDVSPRNASIAYNGLKTANGLNRGFTSVSDLLTVSKKVLMPKQFDRVFNIAVDPDEFEIDYDRTVKTKHGKATMQQLLRNGDVVTQSELMRSARAVRSSNFKFSSEQRQFSQSKYSASDTNSYRFRDRDRSQGDMAFEKYFVSVETINEEQE